MERCRAIEPRQGTRVSSGVGPKIENCVDGSLAAHGVTPESITRPLRRAQSAVKAANIAVELVAEAKPKDDKRLTWKALGFQEWFGEYSAVTLQSLRFRYRTIGRTLASSALKIECNKLESYVCRNDPLAHVEPGIWTIWLCPKYWCSSNHGDDEQVATFIHEAAHIVALATDAKYTAAGARSLAQNNPRRARANADNLSYFATSVGFRYP